MYLNFKSRLKLQLHAAYNAMQVLGINSSVPPAIGWLITERCNMKCMHCTSYLSKEKIDQKKILKIADNIASSGATMVMISGGEPLLVPNLKEVLILFKKAGIKIALNTNGLLLDKYAAFILDNRIDVLTVSFDGPDGNLHDYIRKTPGSFDKIIKNVEFIYKNRKKGIPFIGIRGVILKNNYKSLHLYFEKFSVISDDVKFQPVHRDHTFHSVVDTSVLFDENDKQTEIELKEIIDSLARKYSYLDNAYFKSIPQFIFHSDKMKSAATHHCIPNLLSALYVDSSGNAYICDRKVGNLLEDNVNRIWRNPERIEFLRQLSKAGQCEHPCWVHSHSAKSPAAGKLIQHILKLQ
jgi:MoaA/NifB/PqqE/SkfB family radical SAM enzyme